LSESLAISILSSLNLKDKQEWSGGVVNQSAMGITQDLLVIDQVFRDEPVS
jgi:hypothetical protein